MYGLALEQSRLPEAISYTSILLFHDAIDMFMQLAAEKKGIPKKEKEKLFLMEFFARMPDLTQEASVKRINERRNNIKHGGMIPAKIEVEETAIVAKLFFEENTRAIFDTGFEEVSLLNMIDNQDVVQQLQMAEKEKQLGNFSLCTEAVAKAFYLLTFIDKNDYNTTRYGYHFHRYIRPVDSSYRQISYAFDNTRGSGSWNAAESFDKYLQGALKTFNENFEKISIVLMIVSSGIDYRKYLKFAALTPEVGEVRGKDGATIICYGNQNKQMLDGERCRFLIDFVFECAIKLQQFSYS